MMHSQDIRSPGTLSEAVRAFEIAADAYWSVFDRLNNLPLAQETEADREEYKRTRSDLQATFDAVRAIRPRTIEDVARKAGAIARFVDLTCSLPDEDEPLPTAHAALSELAALAPVGRDAGLIALADELAVIEQALGPGAPSPADQPGRLVERGYEIVEKIAAVPAASVSGLIAKARAAQWCVGDAAEHSAFARLQADILRTLAEMDPRQETAEHPDADLIALAAEFEQAWDAELARAVENEQAWEAGVAVTYQDDANQQVAFDATAAIMDIINAAPAATLRGFIVKARAVQWANACRGEAVQFEDKPTGDLRNATELVNSLLRIGGHL